MSLWQIVEKGDFGTDWELVRYKAEAMQRFNSESEAVSAAKDYLTFRNCDNSLTAEEKRNGLEVFMMTTNGCLLGVLDGKDWYLNYQKDITSKVNGESVIVHRRGDVIKDSSFYELQGKTEVQVRVVPGT